MFGRLFSSKRRVVATAGVVGVMALAGAAIAYFTTTGSGTGTATVGSSKTLTITQTGTISGLVPGGAAKAVTYSISNPTGNGSQNLGVVSATVASVTPVGTNTCATSNFTTAPATSAVGTIADGGSFTSSSAGVEPTVSMTDTGVNQDGCQGATVNLTLSAARGS